LAPEQATTKEVIRRGEIRAEHKFKSAQKRHSKGRTKKEIQRMAQ
jgi:hypothetical protein